MRERLNLWVCAVTMVLLVAMIGLAVAPASAVVVPQDDPLREREFRHPNLSYENVFRPLYELQTGAQQQLGSDLSRLGVDPAHAFFDLRTGRWGTLILAAPMIPGSGVGNDLRWSSLGYQAPPQGEALEQAVWEQFLSYLTEHAAELRIDPQELAEPRVTLIGDRLIQIHAGRTVDGVPVRDTFVKAALNSGNLVLYGERSWGPMEVSTASQLSAAEAENVVRGHVEDFPFARLHEQPHLELIPTSSQPEEAATFLGAGLEYRLAWVLRPYFADHIGSWEALVDAHSGELLSFVDTNHYASRRVEGWIYPVSNDEEGDDGNLQPGYPMPFADLALDGTDVGFTTAGGNVPTGSDPGTISTTLSGQYMRMNDSCGAIDESVAAGDLDLEGVVGGTDCAVPPGHSPGDTNASRTGFYELNRLAEQARGYLPDNNWLDQQLTANMNLNQTCNAFWDGSTVNFFRSAISSGCRNTGEIAAVFDHEWGHGMDDNDGNPNVSSPGEGIADIFAYNRLNDSCIGRGFRIDQNCGGYGDPCIDCTGVRDIDWEMRQSGQPHDIAWIDANCGGGSAPCGGSVHCEGAVYAEAAYDLVNRDLMGFEGSPFDLDLNTALEIGTRLAFYGSSNVGNWYQCTTDGTGGCNADGGYLGFLAADDDNGDITDGTPHMSAIFAAFDRHQISCNVPAVQDSGCAGGPTEAPANVVTTPFDEGVELSWDPVAGASEYWIFRTEGVHGCDFGKALVGKTTETTFSETGLRNEFELSYGVVAVGASDACTSPMSACLSVTPTAGPSGFIEGTVVDADSTAPIADAVVEAVGDVTISDLTDEIGFYRVQVPVGTYDVTANHEDYDAQTMTGVEVLEGETVTLDFALSLTPRPIADISPDSFEFTLQDGEVGTDTLTIGNLGDLDLAWSITTDVPEITTTPNAFDHDPALDEPLDVPDFTIDSPANGGEPFVVTVPAGVLTRGDVVGFSFIGTVAGISDTSSWASDMCMMVEAPDGTTYAVGGFTGTQAGCAVNPWDFDGGGSTDDGTYESFHDNVFPVVGDEGDWTLTFINDWDNTGAATMDWTDVTVTLHKQPLPVCDDATDVPWLSAVPDSGTTAPGSTDEVTVTADSTAAGLGEHEAALCVATNDPDAPVVPVLVSLTVVGDGDEPVIDVDPDSLSSTLQEGESETQPLTISNLGALDLDWQVTETGSIAGGGGQGVARAAMPQRARRSAAASGSLAALRRTAIAGGGRQALDLASVLGEPLPSLRVVNSSNGVVDCEAEPGIIIHDDGSVENGYTGDIDTVTEVRFVDLFTPSAYPTSFSSVCLAFISLGPTSLDFEIVVFDDDGPDEEPGTELGSLAVTADGIPSAPGAPTWFDYDISSLGISIDEGSVYIGARWSPTDAGLVFIAADESTGNPPGFAGGYWWNSTDAVWVPTEDPDLGFEEYRSVMVRAVAVGDGGGDCALPTWVSVSPTSGTVPGGGSQVADVTFDATGLAPDTYTANLCLASNDPVTPLVMVPLTLTVEDGGGVPTADISPDSFTFEVPAGGSDSDILNVGNVGTADLVWTIDEAENTPALLEEWSDDFDSYDTGSQLHGQGGWKGWLNDPAAGALTSDVQAQSAPNSAEIVGASDLVHEYVDSTSGQWTYTAWQFIPTDFTGTSMFIMLNTYDDGGSGLNWSVQVEFRGADEQVFNAGVSGGTLPLIRGEWVELRVEIDLDNDTQEFFYDGQSLYSGTWTGEVSGGGALNIGVVDLFANGASPVYYDDLSLSAAGGGGGCAEPTDVPWLSATPASGTTAPGASDPVDVAVDAATLDPGDYTAQLCVNTNDPDAPLVEVPVNLTVTDDGGPPVADITPDSFTFEVAQGGGDSDTLNVGNIGGEDLTWAIDEAAPIVVPEGAPYRYDLAEMPAFHAPVGASRAAGISRGRGEAPADRVVLPAPQAQAVGSFTEGFDDITTLPGAGWAMINNSEPVGPSSWFQGNDSIFPSHEGAPNAYIAANYESAADGGDISNWLLTPEVTIVNGTTACFWTRTSEQFEEFYDRLEVRMSIAGDSIDVGDTAESVGDFTDLLLSVNPDLEPNEYPEDWAELCVTVRERSREPVTGRFAFRYWVTDTSVNGDYIGIDTVSVTQPDGGPTGGCDSPTDIPWLAADPTSGTTAPGDSVPVDVAVDTAGLDVGDYAALLCVSTNDPNAPLVEVPVSLTVTEGGEDPVIDVDPESLSSSLPPDGTETQPLTIANVGAGTLDWEVTEDDGGFAGGTPAAGGSDARLLPPRALTEAEKLGLAEIERRHVAEGGGAARSWTDPGLIPSDPDGTVRNVFANLGSLTFYDDRGDFQVANPGLPLEDFSDTNAPPNSVTTCLPPFNSDSDDACFSPGDIEPGLSMDVTPNGGLGDAVVLTPPFAGVQCVSVGPNSFVDHADWDFDPPVSAVGFDLQSNVGGAVFTVTMFGPGGELGTMDVTAGGLGVPAFFGVDTSDGGGISRIEVRDTAGAGELFCDVEFGGEMDPPGDCTLPSWVSVDPTSGSVPAGDSQVADVTFDATGLAPGDYSANLCLASNDPATPLVEVPLSLTVTGGGGANEPLDIGDFEVVSPANGGEPVVITVPGGLVNPGDVTGFDFIGTASGVSGNSGWASDTCMIVEAPDGATFSVGGISGTDPACDVNDWDFQGSDSTEDGTYESTHEDVFPGVGDAGDWTFTFINDWDSTDAPTISWTDVTVTLHKVAPAIEGATTTGE